MFPFTVSLFSCTRDMDTDYALLQARFRRSAATFLASFDPELAAVHVQASFDHAPSPLHCPRCARPSLTTRTTSAGQQSKTSRTHVRKQKTTRASHHRRHPCFLHRQCSLCAFEDKQSLDVDPGDASGSMQPTSDAPSISPTQVTGLPTANDCAHGQNQPSSCKAQSHEGRPSKAATDTVLGTRTSNEQPKRRAQKDASQANSTIASDGSSKRSKKKPGLQAMLARSKEQRDKTKHDEAAGSGLAAFLSTL